MFVVAAINLDSRGRSRDPEEALGVQALLLNVTDELGGTAKDSDPSENAWGWTFNPIKAGSLVSPFAVWMALWSQESASGPDPVKRREEHQTDHLLHTKI